MPKFQEGDTVRFTADARRDVYLRTDELDRVVTSVFGEVVMIDLGRVHESYLELATPGYSTADVVFFTHFREWMANNELAGHPEWQQRLQALLDEFRREHKEQTCEP